MSSINERNPRARREGFRKNGGSNQHGRVESSASVSRAGVAQLAPFVSVKQACAIGGFGRSKLYAVVGLGHVRAVKLGAKTLIDTASLLAYLEGLPPARIKGARLCPEKRTSAKNSDSTGA